MTLVVDANLSCIQKNPKSKGFTVEAYIRLQLLHELVVFPLRCHVIRSNNDIDLVRMLQNMLSHSWSLLLSTYISHISHWSTVRTFPTYRDKAQPPNQEKTSETLATNSLK